MSAPGLSTPDGATRRVRGSFAPGNFGRCRPLPGSLPPPLSPDQFFYGLRRQRHPLVIANARKRSGSPANWMAWLSTSPAASGASFSNSDCVYETRWPLRRKASKTPPPGVAASEKSGATARQ